jgi:LysR family glycine cleavage system transcriptional activator
MAINASFQLKAKARYGLGSMSYRLPPLNWLRAFEASARHLSFARAARDLALTPAAVSHQVRSLERHLGQPLFERLARGLRLTEMGAAYLPDLRRSFEDLSATTARLFGQSGRASLAVRAPVSFLTLWLAPRLPRFQARYPAIELLIFATIWADAQPDEAIDLDIRFGNGSWPGYQVERLLQAESVVVCHRDLAARGGERRRLEAISSARLIHVVGHEDHWPALFRRLGMALPRQPSQTRVDNSLTAVTLAAGGGAAIVLRPFAERATQMLPLHLPFAFGLQVDQAHYLLTPLQRGPARPQALLFREWLLAEASAAAAASTPSRGRSPPAGSAA